MKRKKTTITIIAFSVLLIIMGIAYAFVNTELVIDGQSNIVGNWSIEITDITSSPSGSAVNVVPPSAEATYATFHVGFNMPGDSMVYTVTIQNKGNIAAYLDSFSEEYNDTLDVSFTNDITEGVVLEPGDTMTVNVVASYSTDVEFIDTGASVDYTLNLNFLQKNDD